jgi:ADP-ribosyl-[dinitrogen reductase] hydrolase
LAGQPAVDAVARGSWRRERRQIRSGGYVIDTLEAALWAVSRGKNFEEALLLAANLGDDADTVAAVTGQLAGAIWGKSGIPKAWLDVLAQRERIEQLAMALIA